MINNPVIFYSSALILIVFALLTLFAKDIIRALLCSIVVFFAVAIVFYVLGSEYNAIIQASIYGFAVPIIIGVSIMFTKSGKSTAKIKTQHQILLLFAGLFILAFMAIIMLPDNFDAAAIVQVNPFEVISSFAKGIFINYVWAFELVSLLLTIIIAGLSIFRKRGA